MPKVDMWEPEDPRKVYNDLIKRCKEAKEWCISCFVDEQWVPADKFPFEMFITDGVYFFRVIATTHREAALKVLEFVPVIKFLDSYDE
jgi:hypothetical protein